jgi:hypothetical protein
MPSLSVIISTIPYTIKLLSPRATLRTWSCTMVSPLATTSSEFIGPVRRVSKLIAWFLLTLDSFNHRLPRGHIRSPSRRHWTRRLMSATTLYDRHRRQDLCRDCLGSPSTWAWWFYTSTTSFRSSRTTGWWLLRLPKPSWSHEVLLVIFLFHIWVSAITYFLPDPHDLDPVAEIKSLNKGIPANQNLPLVKSVSIFGFWI